MCFDQSPESRSRCRFLAGHQTDRTFDMPSMNNWDSCLVLRLSFADTEIPIQLPQSPSPPPIQQQAHQPHRNVQEHQQPTHQHSNGPPPNHRPLLHGLLSGTHLSQGSYHRGYSSSSTGKLNSAARFHPNASASCRVKSFSADLIISCSFIRCRWKNPSSFCGAVPDKSIGRTKNWSTMKWPFAVTLRFPLIKWLMTVFLFLIHPSSFSSARSDRRRRRRFEKGNFCLLSAIEIIPSVYRVCVALETLFFRGVEKILKPSGRCREWTESFTQEIFCNPPS